MNAADPILSPDRGLIDLDGRLVEADPRLAALNARAGGAIGAPFAIPQIVVLTRLAQRLGIVVARTVLAADGPEEIELWVRAEPDEAGIKLAVSGWRARSAWQPTDNARRDRDLLASDGDWTWEVDSAFVVSAISPRAASYGIDPNGALGRSVDNLFVPREGVTPIVALLAAHQSFEDHPVTIRASGQAALLSGTPRIDAEGGFAGYTGAARRVEHVPVSGTSLSSATEEANIDTFGVQLNRALRGPLGRIVANADSIQAQTDGPIRADYAEYAADIASAGRHLLGLVDDLADLQAVERPDFAPLSEPVDLADVARRAAGLLSVRASERGVRMDLPQDVDIASAFGEFRRCLQILVNLIGNAVRYSPDNGMIWIRTGLEKDQAVVIVADQGKGIAVEDQARIFDKFERVDPSEPSGSGLGLYIARRLARAMGGDLFVDSAPGQGARFVLSLPARSVG